MANAALFIGWSYPVRGRERQSLQVFEEAGQYYGRLQQEGQLESFEPVFLEPHGGDLGGFFLLKGDREALARIRASDEFVRISGRAQTVVEGFGVVGGMIGDTIGEQVSQFQRNIEELT